MADAYIVIAPLVITKKEDGADQYLYEGAALPSHVKGDELKRLDGEGFIAKVTATEAASAKPSSESN